MNLTYRKAQRSDFARINELFIEMLMTIYNTDRADGYSEGDMDRFFDGGEDWICKVEDNGSTVAFLSVEVHREEEEYIYLDDLSVTGTYRNKGIGTSLLMRAEDYSKETGIHSIRLHVEKENTSALGLYKKLGYRIKEEQGSRCLMVKQLQM